MSNTEEYPGPSYNQPEKKGKDPRGQADEEMVKPPARPEVGSKKEKQARPNLKKKVSR